MIGPVAVHDGQPLGAVILRAGLRDIGDPAVEERAFAGQPRIDDIGAFVRGAAPVRRRHDPAFADQFLLQRHVVEVAADRQPVVAARADIAVNEHFGAAVRPSRPVGCSDLAKAGLRQCVGAGRLEQAVVAQVGRDNPGKFLAQRGSARGIGRRGDIAVGGEAGDGDPEIVEIAVETHGPRKAFAFVDRLDLAPFGHGLPQILVLGRERRGDHEREDEQGGLLHRDRFKSKSTK